MQAEQKVSFDRDRQGGPQRPLLYRSQIVTYR